MKLLVVVITLMLTLSHVVVHSAGVNRSEPRTITAKQKSDIVNHHNILRAQEGAADMEMMTWNETLAVAAAQVVATCKWKPSLPTLPGSNFKFYGQNIYMISGASISMVTAVQSWYDEKPNFYYNITRCKHAKTCGNYSQVVWATSHHVGCAYHYCDTMEESSATNAEFLACNYMVQGNHQGEKPFKKGPSCSKCRGAGWCTDKLCNRNCNSDADPDCSCAAHCYNCAKLDLKTCRCSCADGWVGPDCSEPCVEKPERCTATHVCNSMFELVEPCPVTCNLCKPDPDAKPGQCSPVYGPGAAGLTVDNSTKPPDRPTSDDDADSHDESQSQHQQQRRTVALLSLTITLYSSSSTMM